MAVFEYRVWKEVHLDPMFTLPVSWQLHHGWRTSCSPSSIFGGLWVNTVAHFGQTHNLYGPRLVLVRLRSIDRFDQRDWLTHRLMVSEISKPHIDPVSQHNVDIPLLCWSSCSLNGSWAWSLQAVHSLIPGLIHSLKQDGGAKSIANFTNYSTCQAEILWAFRIIGEVFGWINRDRSCPILYSPTFKGVWGFVTGLSSLALIYLSAREDRGGFYSKVIVTFWNWWWIIVSRQNHWLIKGKLTQPKVLRLFTSYQLAKTLLVMLVAKLTGGISLNSWKST